MISEEQKPPTKSPRVKITRNGPYLVYGSIPITQQEIATDPQGIPTHWTQLTEYPTNETCSLCRCGNSAKKPFCDGTHVKINFDGTETADHEPYLAKPKIVYGPILGLMDIEELCASARFCHRDGGIWNLIPQSDNPKAHKVACEEAADCPSGRLAVQNQKTGEIVEPKFSQSIVLIEDPSAGASGPIWIRGGVVVESAKGETYKVRNRATLCRCGKSQNKPFCDSSHYPEEHEPHSGDEQ